MGTKLEYGTRLKNISWTTVRNYNNQSSGGTYTHTNYNHIYETKWLVTVRFLHLQHSDPYISSDHYSHAHIWLCVVLVNGTTQHGLMHTRTHSKQSVKINHRVCEYTFAPSTKTKPNDYNLSYGPSNRRARRISHERHLRSKIRWLTSSANRNTYRILLRSSSMWKPRHPLLRVV